MFLSTMTTWMPASRLIFPSEGYLGRTLSTYHVWFGWQWTVASAAGSFHGYTNDKWCFVPSEKKKNNFAGECFHFSPAAWHECCHNINELFALRDSSLCRNLQPEHRRWLSSEGDVCPGSHYTHMLCCFFIDPTEKNNKIFHTGAEIVVDRRE